MMYRQVIGWFAVLVMLANTACTTTQSYAGSEIYEYAALDPGESVKITEIDGSEYDLKVIDVTGTSVVGERAGVGTVDVPFETIQYAEIRQFDAEKTYWRTMGVASVVSVIALLWFIEATDATWGL